MTEGSDTILTKDHVTVRFDPFTEATTITSRETLVVNTNNIAFEFSISGLKNSEKNEFFVSIKAQGIVRDFDQLKVSSFKILADQKVVNVSAEGEGIKSSNKVWGTDDLGYRKLKVMRSFENKFILKEGDVKQICLAQNIELRVETDKTIDLNDLEELKMQLLFVDVYASDSEDPQLINKRSHLAEKTREQNSVAAIETHRIGPVGWLLIGFLILFLIVNLS